jgi:hypothetical protein
MFDQVPDTSCINPNCLFFGLTRNVCLYSSNKEECDKRIREVVIIKKGD